jgi:hypothetical protein
MSLRLPQNFSSGFATESRLDSGLSVLERELKAEQAGNLGRLARAVEKALEALRNAPDSDAALRSMLTTDAAQAVWCYFVQREVCGITSHDEAIKAYAIPRQVLARVGAATANSDGSP